ncbi:MAG: transglycosylase SLT domain-containing protein [Candidatus Micrarchaeia archaeon]
MSGLLKRLVAAVLLPSAIFAASLFPPSRTSSVSPNESYIYSNDDNNSNVCRNQSTNSALEMLLQDPNGVSEERDNESEPQKCKLPPISSTSLRKDPKFLLELVRSCPDAVSILSQVWVMEYTTGTHSNVIQSALFRTLRKGELLGAVRGFQEGLAEREAKNGNLTPKEREELRALSFIPLVESNWSYTSSPKKAAGPYQFTRETAIKYGLVREHRDKKGRLIGVTDKRHKNYDSAKAAAQLLYDLYITFNRDMYLTLSAYNSGLPWKYLANSKKSKKPISYQDYLKFLVASAENTGNKPDALRGFVENVNYVPKVLAMLTILSTYYPEFVDFATGKISHTKLKEMALANANYPSPTYKDLNKKLLKKNAVASLEQGNSKIRVR